MTVVVVVVVVIVVAMVVYTGGGNCRRVVWVCTFVFLCVCFAVAEKCAHVQYLDTGTGIYVFCF